MKEGWRRRGAWRIAGAACVVALAGCGGREPAQQPAAEPEQAAEPPPDFIQEAVWNRDGSRLAASWYRGDRYRIFGLFGPYEGNPPDPSEGLPITNGEASWASWSADGMWVAFETDRDGNNEVYRVHPDGMGPENLTQNPAEDGEPDYAPGGRRIVFTSDRGGDGRALWVMAADGSDPRPLGTDLPGSEPMGPVWSPDGRRIAYYAKDGGSDGIFVVGADGSGARRVADGVFPAWAPDGAALFYDRADSVFRRPPAPDGSETFVTRGFAARPSPDGRWLAFVRGEWPTSALYLLDMDNGVETRVTP
ncbi:MAG: hypothetical protein PVJ02_04840 [Gemmatimonadota bacterium]